MKIFMVIAGCLLICGCGEKAEPKHFEMAQELCGNNGGIDHIKYDYGIYEIVCNNKATFDAFAIRNMKD